jgi:hypothetical protein
VLGRVVPFVVLVALAAFGYGEYSRRAAVRATAVDLPAAQETSAPFRCDGRTHCSQMTSCAEATFFLRNCPGVQMDGNHDGVPCETQWCTRASAR